MRAHFWVAQWNYEHLGTVTNESKITIEQLFRFYRGLPHQLAAISELEEDLKANGYEKVMVRSRPWFQTWSQAGKIPSLKAAEQIIKEFEGLYLKAYPDPLTKADPWTIGYGATKYANGRPVKEGDVITREQAEDLLKLEIEFIAKQLSQSVPHWREMTDEQKSAIVSFAFNLGTKFYGSAGFETITRALKAREWDKVPDALLLYRNPGTNVEAGLKRRRIAEGELWKLGLVARPNPAQSLPLQQATPASKVALNVPYEFQLDNKSGFGYRECFSSSCAMIARYYGKVANDDAYNSIRAKYGDTTDPYAQVKALQSLGLKAQYTQSGDATMLEAELRAGRPVAVGWLHHGPSSAPTGGGHWTVITGFTPDTFLHNDPNGEADLVRGGYISTKGGKSVVYGRKNWMPRWRVNGSGGWAIKVSPQ